MKYHSDIHCYVGTYTPQAAGIYILDISFQDKPFSPGKSTSIHMHIHMHAYTYIYIHIHTCLYIYIYIYIYAFVFL